MSTADTAGYTTSDHVYRVVDGIELSGTYYEPKQKRDGPLPLILEVHGGAWTRNDRHTNYIIHRYLAERGIAVFSVDFRYPPQAKYPVTVEDVNYATRWLKQHAERFGSRRELVGGVATSSGGHLLMLSLLRSRSGGYQHDDDGLTERDASLPFVVACWPVLDPTARLVYAKANHRERLIEAHRVFWNNEAEMADANPLRIVQRGETVAQPAVLLLQGSNDENFDFRNTVDFADAYMRNGGEVELHVYDGAPHAFIKEDPPGGVALEALGEMHRFIEARTAWALRALQV